MYTVCERENRACPATCPRAVPGKGPMKKTVLTYTSTFYLTGLLVTVCTASSLLLFAGSQAQNLHLPASSIHQMVKNVAWNELQATEHPKRFYQYLERDISPGSSRTYIRIATPHGYVDRLIAVNGHQPSKQQIEKNEQLLQNLLTNTQLQHSRFKNQQSNLLRRDNVIKDVPNAFVFTYDGRSKQGWIKLKFRPAPNFNPSSRQSLVLEGMAGELWVDPKTQRMAKIDGSLIKPVKIGWGFLARLNKGGRFLMDQVQGPDGTWHQQLLHVHFDGSVFIFKPLHIRVKEIRSFFKRVPDNLTIPEAVHMLQTDIKPPKDWKSRLDSIEKSAQSN